MKLLRRPASRHLRWKLFSVLLSVVLTREALATIPLYQNVDVANYDVYNTQISPNPPPTIDAIAFENKNVFTVNYANYSPSPVLFQTWNTLNVTNVSDLIANSPAVTNGATFFFGLGTFGSGYQFDLHTTNQISHAMAGTFYNPGRIRCDSIQDGNNLFSLGGNGFLYLVTSLGQFKASATNIIIPGSIDVGTGGKIQLTGRNVDLSGGVLTVESPLNNLGNPFLIGTLGAVNFNSTGVVGLDTNSDWVPSTDLTLNTAQSGFVPIPPFYVTLTNSQSFVDSRQPVPNHFINRYVFIQNVNPAVPYKVFIDDPNAQSLGFDSGSAHVEWTGGYIDPSSGSQVARYLYLTDDYLFGTSTNNLVINGVPESFTFITSPTQLLFGPTPTNFAPLNFPPGPVTNRYAAMFATLSAASVNTNASIVNPSGNVTNLPGAVKISASNTLNLAFTTISGPNYFSLNCTNQFIGSPGAAIAAPFSDISLGVTNGFLTFSNVLMANLPVFSGTIQAWSTAWTNIDTVLGVTNDNRVLIVYSDLNPTTPPWIQNLYLHGTNALVISDPLNVFGSLYSDAKSVTLNTNDVGVGASSLDGELSWQNSLPLNANSGGGVQQFPNLLWLTNNGAIRVWHNANFGNSGMPQFVVTPGVPAVPATGTLSKAGTNAVINDKVTIGTNLYTFVNTLVNTTANQIKWANTADSSLSNLIAAINGATGGGTKYSTATKSNRFVSAGVLVNHAFTVTSRTNGTIGNTITTLFSPATASSNLTWLGLITLTNGLDAIPPITNYPSFVNHSFITDEGTAIWTTYFEHTGLITNGPGSFVLHAGMAVLTNSSLYAGGDVILLTTNSPGTGVDGLLLSNVVIKAGHKLTISTTNLLGDSVTNGNLFVVGETSGGGTVDSGFNIPIKPPLGDLLGTTVTNIAPFNKTIYNIWAGNDYGRTTVGYTNNLAVGHLVLDAKATNIFGPVAFNFTGAGVSNALYIDLLELKDGAGFGNNTNNFNFPWLKINTNMFVYYAQALINGVSVAEAIDNQSKLGANGGRLRWVYSYAGYLSSTNIVYPDGSSNLVNTALAQSSTIDSDGDGIPNSTDPTPFFVQTNMSLTVLLTNVPPQSARIQWSTVPNATNFIFYSTNMITTNCWHPFTNFQNWYYGNNVAVTNSAHSNYFKSPQIYINNASLPDNSQQTNVWVLDPLTNGTHYYKVLINPWLNFPN